MVGRRRDGVRGSSFAVNYRMNRKQQYIMHGGTGRNASDPLASIQLTVLVFSTLDSHNSHLNTSEVQAAEKKMSTYFYLYQIFLFWPKKCNVGQKKRCVTPCVSTLASVASQQ